MGNCYFVRLVVLISILFISCLVLGGDAFDNVMTECSNLCSMGWFERKLMVVSVVVGWRNMSISMLGGFEL